jgi:hypothetical protein
VTAALSIRECWAGNWNVRAVAKGQGSSATAVVSINEPRGLLCFVCGY